MRNFRSWIFAAAALIVLSVAGLRLGSDLRAQQVPSSASVFREQRFGATTATTATAGNQATTTYTWSTGFADANYSVNCTGITPTGTPALAVNANPTATQVVVVVTAITAAASSYANVHCVAMHD